MSVIDQLLKLADAAEAEAATYRSTAALLGRRLRAAAAQALPAKLRQAARLRAEAAPAVEATPTPTPKKGALLAFVAGLLTTRRRIHEDKLPGELKAAGFEGRGIGALHRAKLIVADRHGWIRMTNKGRARAAQYAEGAADRERRTAARKRGRPRKVKATPGTNGKGHGSQTKYVAEIVAANSGPISGTDILAKAKADGRSITPQAIGAAKRYKLIAGAPPANGERMFQAPA